MWCTPSVIKQPQRDHSRTRQHIESHILFRHNYSPSSSNSSKMSSLSLLDLPAEIRLEIYEYVIGNPRARLCLYEAMQLIKVGARIRPSYHTRSDKHTSGAILQVCHLMTAEALPVWYRATEFLVLTKITTRGCSMWSHFHFESVLRLHAVPYDLVQVKHLRLCLEMPWDTRNYEYAFATLATFVDECSRCNFLEVELIFDGPLRIVRLLNEFCDHIRAHPSLRQSVSVVVVHYGAGIDAPLDKMWPDMHWKDITRTCSNS